MSYFLPIRDARTEDKKHKNNHLHSFIHEEHIKRLAKIESNIFNIIKDARIMYRYTITGGNSRTAMVAALSPADVNYDETLSTLRYNHLEL